MTPQPPKRTGEGAVAWVTARRQQGQPRRRVNREPPSPQQTRPTRLPLSPTAEHLLWVLLLGLSFGGYFMLRYQGYWAEIDTSVFITAIGRYQEVRELSYQGAYLHGYAYVTWLATLSDFTGVSVPDLVQLYLPMLSTLFIAVFGYAAFRQLLGSPRLGLMATGTLFLVPEFVFTVARGNHEKIDISMILLALLSLSCALRELTAPPERRRWGLFALWVLTFHFAGFTLATSNTFFGSTFAAALSLGAIALGLGPVLARRVLKVQTGGAGAAAHVLPTLRLGVAVTWGLVLMVMWYLYPAASHQLDILGTVFDRFASLFLSFDTQSNPYSALRQEWASQLAYRVVSSFRWMIFFVSFLMWIGLSWRALRRLDHTPVARQFLLTLYGAFGVLLAVSIPVDFLGLAEGSNLQVRLYTYFILFAAPLFALGLALLAPRLPRLGRWPTLALRVTLLAFAFLSVIKATVDPVISNLWTFYQPGEVQAVRFWAQQQQYAALWVGTRGRLDFAYATRYGTFRPERNYLATGTPEAHVEMAVDSPIIRAQAAAERYELPTLLTGNLVYDNGEAQLYRRVPTGPFGR